MYQSRCRGSQRQPGDGLPVAPSGSRHQKIGEIRASDQQNEGDTTEQKQQRTAYCTKIVDLQREDGEAKIRDSGCSVEYVYLCGNRVCFGLCAREVASGVQPANQMQKCRPARV